MNTVTEHDSACTSLLDFTVLTFDSLGIETKSSSKHSVIKVSEKKTKVIEK